MTMYRLYSNLTEDTANTYGLVLSASGIFYQLNKEGRGWDLWIEDTAVEKAQNAILLFLEENQSLRLPEKPEVFQKTFAGLWAAIILLAAHVAVAVQGENRSILVMYGSSAEHILAGEVFRLVTGLMLHANNLHLSGNMLGILLFGTAVCSIMGWGLGLLLILASGMTGNLITALLYKTNHLSVGASTAVFGAIGILAAYQFLKKTKIAGQRIKAWLPLGGGLALLGILGSGQYVDIAAHLFGFFAGILFGCLYVRLFKRPAPNRYQAGFLFISLIIVIASWIAAFSSP